MSKRKYTQLKAVEELILAMRQDGMTLRGIGDELELFSKSKKCKLFRKAGQMSAKGKLAIIFTESVAAAKAAIAMHDDYDRRSTKWKPIRKQHLTL